MQLSQFDRVGKWTGGGWEVPFLQTFLARVYKFSDFKGFQGCCLLHPTLCTRSPRTSARSTRLDGNLMQWRPGRAFPTWFLYYLEFRPSSCDIVCWHCCQPVDWRIWAWAKTFVISGHAGVGFCSWTLLDANILYSWSNQILRVRAFSYAGSISHSWSVRFFRSSVTTSFDPTTMRSRCTKRVESSCLKWCKQVDSVALLREGTNAVGKCNFEAIDFSGKSHSTKQRSKLIPAVATISPRSSGTPTWHRCCMHVACRQSILCRTSCWNT